MICGLIKKLKLPEYRYVWMLLYWPILGLVFWSLEFMDNREYVPVYSVLDDMIPFCKYFIVPYFFWFVYIIGTMAYFFFKDKSAFVKYMWTVIITHTITLIIYIVYPTCQELRPEITGDGFFEFVLRWLYGYDTNTNVCPSIHVTGACAVCFAVVKSKAIKSRIIKVVYIILNVLICLSTVFIKQHSIIDVVAGLAVSTVTYPFIFMENKASAVLEGLFVLKGKKEVVQGV